jgi:ethanolamine utilization protein EutN
VCADCVGAGEGERVLVATGAAARTAAGRDLPVDAAVVGIVDAGQTGRT